MTLEHTVGQISKLKLVQVKNISEYVCINAAKPKNSFGKMFDIDVFRSNN